MQLRIIIRIVWVFLHIDLCAIVDYGCNNSTGDAYYWIGQILIGIDSYFHRGI